MEGCFRNSGIIPGADISQSGVLRVLLHISVLAYGVLFGNVGLLLTLICIELAGTSIPLRGMICVPTPISTIRISSVRPRFSGKVL